jgi:hypothetical protein
MRHTATRELHGMFPAALLKFSEDSLSIEGSGLKKSLWKKNY